MKMTFNKTVCPQNQCTGCMACIDTCHKDAIVIEDGLDAYNAVIDEGRCVECGRCHDVCPNNRHVDRNSPISWYQGWAEDEGVRALASSGGVATALSLAFVNDGGIVCSCLFESGEFKFAFASAVDGVKRFAGSKYVKSNPKGVYANIKEYLKKTTKVLFIGLPCQVAAVKNYAGDDKNLYTVDLICHGTPSPKFLEMYLKENGYSLMNLKDVKFRKKNIFYLSDDYNGIKPVRVRDRYTLSFLNSLNYTENCYSCRYASSERVSDITLGDSWGTTLSQEEKAKGISLILCQTKKGEDLLKIADLHLEYADFQKAVEKNKQLMHPSVKPSSRGIFYKTLNKTNKFCKSVTKSYPKICLKQDIKELLIKYSLYYCKKQ